MADDPFRLRIAKAVTMALAEITPAAGYKLDLSGTGTVQRGRAMYGEGDPLPLVSILESIDENTDVIGETDGTQDGGDWDLLIQGFVQDDPYNPTDPAYVLLADVRRRLLVEKARKHPTARNQPDPFGMGVVSLSGTGNAILGLTIGRGVVRPPIIQEGISDKTNFWLRLRLRIVEDGLNPYA